MSPDPHAFMPLSRPPTARAAISLGHLWRVLVDALGALRAERRAAGQKASWERRGLADLDERMLRDIGASQWHAANAATRAYDDLRTRINGGLG